MLCFELCVCKHVSEMLHHIFWCKGCLQLFPVWYSDNLILNVKKKKAKKQLSDVSFSWKKKHLCVVNVMSHISFFLHLMLKERLICYYFYFNWEGLKVHHLNFIFSSLSSLASLSSSSYFFFLLFCFLFYHLFFLNFPLFFLSFPLFLIFLILLCLIHLSHLFLP